MGRKKKSSTEKVDAKIVTAYEYPLSGGPRDGQKIRLQVPPAKYIRLAFPEWASYLFDIETGTYLYEGEEPIPSASGTSAWINGDQYVKGWTP